IPVSDLSSWSFPRHRVLPIIRIVPSKSAAAKGIVTAGEPWARLLRMNPQFAQQFPNFFLHGGRLLHDELSCHAVNVNVGLSPAFWRDEALYHLDNFLWRHSRRFGRVGFQIVHTQNRRFFRFFMRRLMADDLAQEG